MSNNAASPEPNAVTRTKELEQRLAITDGLLRKTLKLGDSAWDDQLRSDIRAYLLQSKESK